MFKINLVVCLFYFLSSPSNKANTSWYVVEEGSLLHSVLLRHLVVDQDVAGAPLDWPGLGRDYRVTPVVEGWIVYLVSHPVRHTAGLDHVVVVLSVGGCLPLSPLSTPTLAVTVPHLTTCNQFLVAKATLEIAGHGHWICLWVNQSNFSISYMKSYWCHNDVIKTKKNISFATIGHSGLVLMSVFTW